MLFQEQKAKMKAKQTCSLLSGLGLCSRSFLPSFVSTDCIHSKLTSTSNTVLFSCSRSLFCFPIQRKASVAIIFVPRLATKSSAVNSLFSFRWHQQRTYCEAKDQNENSSVTAEERAELANNKVWYYENRDSLIHMYLGKWIAIHGQKVVASSSDPAKLLRLTGIIIFFFSFVLHSLF
jgi:hypothetical protein